MKANILKKVIASALLLTVTASFAACGKTESTTATTAAAVSEARQLTNKAVAEALDGLPDYKMHCSVLAQEAIESALKDYESRQEKK